MDELKLSHVNPAVGFAKDDERVYFGKSHQKPPVIFWEPLALLPSCRSNGKSCEGLIMFSYRPQYKYCFLPSKILGLGNPPLFFHTRTHHRSQSIGNLKSSQTKTAKWFTEILKTWTVFIPRKVWKLRIWHPCCFNSRALEHPSSLNPSKSKTFQQTSKYEY